ncbi:hypothetical protein ERJ75_000626500 [Trypanosoma vivax]|nr:hypothetical protein ERJ75_000685500 [Trypanosoma vivax]KAH8615038.1 hypothetical protein ERJ75_000626500 [Trypanosoma vivax]
MPAQPLARLHGEPKRLRRAPLLQCSPSHFQAQKLRSPRTEWRALSLLRRHLHAVPRRTARDAFQSLLDGLLDFTQISACTHNREVVRKETILQPRDALETLAQRIHRDNEQRRSQHRPLRDTTREADILQQYVVHPHLRRASLQKQSDPRHQMLLHGKGQ